MTRSAELTGIAPETGWEKYGRALGFVVVGCVPVIVLLPFVRLLATLIMTDDTYTHIPLIPVVSAFLIYSERQRIYAQARSGWQAGAALTMAGLACLALVKLGGLNWSETGSSVMVLGLVLVWAGAFGIFFGTSALREARFPLLFLLFMVPIPEPVLSRTILCLQQGSADATAAIFSLCGIPFLRHGFDFALPGVAIRVAEECSGIRSTLALLIMAVLAGHLYLSRAWKTVFLCAAVFPVAILKNGLRIATLSELAVYVNPGFLTGRLHRYGGMVFFAAGLVPLALLLSLLQKIGQDRRPGTIKS